MADSFIQYTASGSTDTFNIPFGYLDSSHISVEVNSVDTAFTFPSASQVQITSGNPATDAVVQITRTTPRDAQEVVWQNASNLTAGDLNTADLQMLYIIQESFDQNATVTASDVVTTTANVAACELALDTFDDRFLGVKSSDPTLDNDGDALVSGTIYWSSTSGNWRYYNGSTWADMSTPATPASSVISYDNATSGLTATDVKAAIDELDAVQDGHGTMVSEDSADYYTKTEVDAFSPTGTSVNPTAIQLLPTNTWSVINFDSEDYDDDGWHDNVTNNSRITIDANGRYICAGSVGLQFTSNGDIGIALAVNGSIVKKVEFDTGVTVNTKGVTISYPLALSASDYVELHVFQHVGSSVNTVYTETNLTVIRLK